MDWPIFLINLDRDRDRLVAASAELARAQMTFQRIPGVYGRALTQDEIARAYDANANARRARHPLTPAEIGCYLGHIAAWRALVASGAKGGVVLEDDFRVIGDLPASLAALARDHGPWDMVKLFTFRPDAKRLAPREIAPGLHLSTPYRVPTTMLGYVLRRAAAERLIARSIPFFRPVDEDMKFFWEKELKIDLLTPQPIEIGDQTSAEGSVGDSRRDAAKRDGRSALRRALTGIRYQAGYTAALHRHRWLP